MAEKVTTKDRGAVRILTINRPISGAASTARRPSVSGARSRRSPREVVPRGQALRRAFELAETIASYPNFPGICADRRAVLEGLSLGLDEGIVLEARVVRPQCFSEEVQAGLRRFAGGARAMPRRGRQRCRRAENLRAEENQRWKRRHGYSMTRR